MIKNYLLKAGVALLLSLMFSCDNTTADPLNQNNPNNNSGGNGSTGPTITGPRILHKIVNNNVTMQEYVTNGNILQKGIFKEASGPTSFLIGNVTYTAGKVSKVKFAQENNGVPVNSLTYDFDVTYDSDGKINSTICNASIGTLLTYRNEYTYMYDGSGKMTKIVEKRKSGTTYTHFTNYNLTNAGDNITKLITEAGMTSATGVPDMSTVITSTYNFSAYDNKINPYTTLPRTFFVMWSLVHPINFSSLSANNLTTFSIVYSSTAPVIPGSYTYLYDSQNYPSSDQTQSQKYIYKAL